MLIMYFIVYSDWVPTIGNYDSEAFVGIEFNLPGIFPLLWFIYIVLECNGITMGINGSIHETVICK